MAGVGIGCRPTDPGRCPVSEQLQPVSGRSRSLTRRLAFVLLGPLALGGLALVIFAHYALDGQTRSTALSAGESVLEILQPDLFSLYRSRENVDQVAIVTHLTTFTRVTELTAWSASRSERFFFYSRDNNTEPVDPVEVESSELFAPHQLVLVRTLSASGTPFARIRLVVSTDDTVLSWGIHGFLALLILLMFVGGVLIWRFVRSTLTGPIETLSTFAVEVGQSRAYDRRIEPHGPAEIIALGQAINALLDRVQQHQTEELQFVQERIEMLKRVQQKQRLEAVGELASGVAHDFNNILTAIASFAYLVHSDPTNPMALDDLDEITKATKRGADLTGRLLQFAATSPRKEVTVDLNQVLLDVRSLLEKAVQGDDVQLLFQLAPGPRPVRANVGELEQVLMNLVINARDACAGHGQIEIQTRASADGLRTELVVIDHGMGMSPEVEARIFEPFFSTKPVGRGTGLGLASVHGIVSRWGGTIAVQTAPGEGSRFTISLPTGTGAIAEADDVQPAARSGAPLRILLVEDASEIRLATTRALQQLGHTVVSAGDGKEGLAAFRRCIPAPDIIVSDIVMPTLSGVDMLAALRADGIPTPVLLVTGHPKRTLDDGALELGSVDLLRKPYTMESLLERLDRLLAEAPHRAPTSEPQSGRAPNHEAP